jgi:hypothetical protein
MRARYKRTRVGILSVRIIGYIKCLEREEGVAAEVGLGGPRGAAAAAHLTSSRALRKTGIKMTFV